MIEASNANTAADADDTTERPLMKVLPGGGPIPVHPALRDMHPLDNDGNATIMTIWQCPDCGHSKRGMPPTVCMDARPGCIPGVMK